MGLIFKRGGRNGTHQITFLIKRIPTMNDHIKEAEKEVQLARLLGERVGTRDDEAREQIRERIEAARLQLSIAEDELDRIEAMGSREQQ